VFERRGPARERCASTAQVLGFRAFLLRGVRKVKGEWNLVCAAINLRGMNALMAQG
jgi:hypothetical protein